MARASAPPLPEGVTAGQMARVAGVSERVILGRKSDGRLPVRQDGSIDLHAVIKAGITALAAEAKGEGGAGDLDANRARESRLRGDRLELLNAQLRAELIPAEEMEAIVGAAFDASRSKVLSVPASLSPRLAAEPDPVKVRDMLTGSLHDALSDLATGEVVAAVKDRARRLAGRLENAEPSGEEAGAAA